jgi:putative transposase
MNAYLRNSALYKGHRFPAEIISHCVWVYYRFCLSFRDVAELMLARGVVVSHEAVRFWTVKFGAEYTRRLRARRGPCGDIWHLDEVFCKINGELVYLWRAVDQSGEVLDVLVQRRRSKRAAKRFFRKLLKGLRYSPRTLVTDKLRSYAAAKGEMMPGVAHHCGRRVNNHAENSHQPTRQRERRMQRFKSLRHAQRFCSAFSSVCNQFRPGRHTLSASNYRALMRRRFAQWNDVVETNGFVTAS